MDVVTVVGTLFILVFAAVLLVGNMGRNAHRRVARVPVVIRRNKPGIRPRNNDGPEHIL